MIDESWETLPNSIGYSYKRLHHVSHQLLSMPPILEKNTVRQRHSQERGGGMLVKAQCRTCSALLRRSTQSRSFPPSQERTILHSFFLLLDESPCRDSSLAFYPFPRVRTRSSRLCDDYPPPAAGAGAAMVLASLGKPERGPYRRWIPLTGFYTLLSTFGWTGALELKLLYHTLHHSSCTKPATRS